MYTPQKFVYFYLINLNYVSTSSFQLNFVLEASYNTETKF